MDPLRHLRNRKLTAGLLLVLALLLVGFGPSPVAVDAAAVVRGALRVSVD